MEEIAKLLTLIKKALSASRAFSIIEIVVSSSVFVLAMMAILGAFVYYSKAYAVIADKAKAVYLAEEGVEAVKSIRNSDFTLLSDGSFSLATTSNQYSLVPGGPETVEKYNRQITVTSIDENRKKVNVAVTWPTKIGGTGSVSLLAYLNNWQITVQNMTAGLTVNKTVINHGGSKVAADFAPYQVGTTTIELASSTIFALGTYTISETADIDYVQSFSGDCDSAGSITLTDSASKTCLIVNEEKYAPVVTAPTSAAVAETTATLGANVTSLGLPAVISARGTCWGTTPAPVTNCLAEGGLTTGVFTQARIGFTAGTLYYYRGYATNSTGTGYSADGTFTTSAADCTETPWGTMLNGTSNTGYLSSTVTFPGTCISEIRTCVNGTLSGSYTNISCSVTPVIPTVTTVSPLTSISRTTATGGGDVASEGGAPVTARGVVWSTSINPTIALATKTSDGTGAGIFSSSITSLTCNTLYHVRAYATNSVGTNYGLDVAFTTSACSSITFVGRASANGTTVSIPAHNVGDLLVMFAYRSSNNAPPTVPSGWTTINASGAANNSSSLAYRIATGADSGSGWSNATQLIVQVYRGVSASPIGANGVQHANSKIVTYPALSLSVADGSSWVIGSAGAASNSTPIEVAPTGMTARANIVGGSAEASGHDTNGGVSSWTAQNVTISGVNVKWSARTLEIKSQ